MTVQRLWTMVSATSHKGWLVMALRPICVLLRRVRGPVPALAASAASQDVYLPIADLRARQFAVKAVDDPAERGRPAPPRVNGLKHSRNVQKAVERLLQLPTGKSSSFYSQEVWDALQGGDLPGAVAIMETLHRRHPDKAVLTQYAYNLILRHLCKQQFTLPNANLSRILGLLDTMIRLGRVNQSSFQVAMAACSRARDRRSANHVVEKMRASGRQPDARMYGFWINCCARKRGLVGEAERYLDEMLSEGLKPTILVLNAMLRVYARDIGRSERMVELVQRALDEFNVHPNSVTTRMVIYYLSSEGKLDDAVNFLRFVESMLPRLDGEKSMPVKRPVMNALIDACIHRGNWELADDVLALSKSILPKPTDAQKDIANTEKLEEQVTKRKAMASPLVWVLGEQDLTHMTIPQRKGFWLARSRKEGVDRALQHLNSGGLAANRRPIIAKLSLRLEGKLQVLNEMINAGSVSAAEFNAALSACGRDGQLAMAESVLSEMKQFAKSAPECIPTTWSYNSLLNACAVTGDIHHVESIILEMVENNLLPDLVTMNTVLKAHVTSLSDGAGGGPQDRLNNVMQALSFYEWCSENQKLDPVAATYYSLFRLFNVFLEDTRDTSNLVVNEDDAHIDVEREEDLKKWMEEFIKTACRDAPRACLDIGVFNTAFDYFYRVGDVDGSLTLCNVMRQRDFSPDNTTLGLIFATCANSQQNEVGLNFLDHLMAQGYKPTVDVLNGAMGMCANSNNPGGALELLRAMESSNEYEPTLQSYEGVVRAFARVGDVATSWSIIGEMERKLGKVSVHIYNRVLEACSVAGAPERALEVLDMMRHTNGVVATVESYNMTLKAFAVAGAQTDEDDTEEDEKEDIFDEDFDEGFDKDLDGSEDYIDVESEEYSDYTDDAEQIRDHELSLRERATWVCDTVINLLTEMHKSRKAKPDKTSYEAAIAACTLHEDPGSVISIFDRLIVRKQEDKSRVLKSDLVSDDSISAYLEACMGLQEKERIIEVSDLLQKWHIATGQTPSLSALMQLLNSLESVGEWRLAVRLLPDMQARFGITPSVVLFNRVMQMCNSAGEHQLVPPIFATMQDATAYRVFPDSESYIQRIYAEEQREDWIMATDLFVEMQKKCRSEDISLKQLRMIALGRYSLRQREC